MQLGSGTQHPRAVNDKLEMLMPIQLQPTSTGPTSTMPDLAGQQPATTVHYSLLVHRTYRGHVHVWHPVAEPTCHTKKAHAPRVPLL
jgi:hypothetical protein